MKIGFIGLGSMGSPIAANLLRARHTVTVWNRSANKTRELLDAGAVSAASPKAAASAGDAVITMLADDAALEQVLSGAEGILQGLRPGALHISMSTISVTTAERISALHAARGQRFLSAPVFGRPEAAAAAKLFVVAAGGSADFKTASALFPSISQRVFYVGEVPSTANLVKLCGNFMILAAIEALGEAMALAQRGGVPKRTAARSIDRHAVRLARVSQLRDGAGRGSIQAGGIRGPSGSQGYAARGTIRGGAAGADAAAERAARPPAPDHWGAGRRCGLVGDWAHHREECRTLMAARIARCPVYLNRYLA